MSTLPFTKRSQMQAGVTAEETWTNEFTLDAGSNKMYRIDDDIKAGLENGVKFAGSGAVHVSSAQVEITPAEVSWTEDRSRYTAPGARMVSHVTWTVSADASEGATGEIHAEFPRLPQISNYLPNFHSATVEKKGDGRWSFLEVTAHRSAAGMALGRFLAGLIIAFPVTMFLHSIWWMSQVKDEKKVRLAMLAQSSGQPLPRTFYSSPVEEWDTWTVLFGIFGFISSIVAGLIIYQGLSSFANTLVFAVTAFCIIITILLTVSARSSVVTVRVDADTIAYAKGRGEPLWVTARWSELRRAALKTEKSSRSGSREWVELTFPDGKTRQIPSSVMDYPLLRDMILVLYDQQRQAASTPEQRIGMQSSGAPEEKTTMTTGSLQPGTDQASNVSPNKPSSFGIPAKLYVFLLFMFQFMSIIFVAGFGVSYLPDPLLPKILGIAGIVLAIVVLNVVASLVGRVIPVRCGHCRLRTRFLGLGWWPFIYRFACTHCGMEMKYEVQGGV